MWGTRGVGRSRAAIERSSHRPSSSSLNLAPQGGATSGTRERMRVFHTVRLGAGGRLGTGKSAARPRPSAAAVHVCYPPECPSVKSASPLIVTTTLHHAAARPPARPGRETRARQAGRAAHAAVRHRRHTTSARWLDQAPVCVRREETGTSRLGRRPQTRTSRRERPPVTTSDAKKVGTLTLQGGQPPNPNPFAITG